MKASYVLVFFFVVLLFAGCKKEDNPTEPQPTGGQSGTYVGTVASGTESGSISLDVNISKPVGTDGSVTGTLKIVSPTTATINLSGSYSANTLTVTGGNYSFNGVLNGGSFQGTYSGPNGSGQFNAQPSANNSVKVFAGTYTSSTIAGRHGTFNIVIDGTAVSGYAISSGDNEGTPLSGTLSGSNINLLGGVAVGTISGTTVNGTYDNGEGDSGVWSGNQIN